VNQDFDPTKTSPVTEAEALTGMISALRPAPDPAPGYVLLSPLEVAAAEGR
jgi:hypothetical protein